MKKIIFFICLFLSFNANASQAYLQRCDFDGSVYIGTYRTMGGTYFQLMFGSYCPFSVNM